MIIIQKKQKKQKTKKNEEIWVWIQILICVYFQSPTGRTHYKIRH